MKLDEIGVLFGKSWARLKGRYGIALGVLAIPTVLLTIGKLLLVRQSAVAVILSAPVNFVAVILYIVASIAIISLFGGKDSTFIGSCRTGFMLFWSSIWITLLIFFAFAGGFVLLIIPAIMLSFQLSFANYALVLDGKRGMAALAQSRAYVKGYWWAVAGRMMLLVLMLLVVLIVIFAPLDILLGASAGVLIQSVIVWLATPVLVAYQYEIFENLRSLKPNVAEEAAKADSGFLKVVMVIGVIVGIALLVSAIVGGFYLATHPNADMNYQYQYPYQTPSISAYPPGISTYPPAPTLQ